MGDLSGKVAVVTGASRGIGRAIAERLGRDGASVVVNFAGSAGKAQEVVATIEGDGSEAIAVQADMGTTADIRRLFEEATERFGRLDILVVNAGTAIYKPHAEVTEEEFDRVFALNTKGAFFALQEAAKRIEDGGRIVSISTGGTVQSSPTAGLYTGSKAPIEQFTEALAQELGGRGVTVNTVLPGLVETDGVVISEEQKEQVIAQTPLGRIGQSEDVADVVAFLVSEEARWVTAQNVRAGGGLI